MRDSKGKFDTEHGMCNTPTYKTWHLMKQRCHNPKAPDHKNYGARGIEVCAEWRDSFIKFMSDMGKRPVGHQLDREDNDKGCSKHNCRWVTPARNANNKRNCKMLTYNNRTQSLQSWCNELNLPRAKIYGRLLRGWSIEEALSNRNNCKYKGAR